MRNIMKSGLYIILVLAASVVSASSSDATSSMAGAPGKAGSGSRLQSLVNSAKSILTGTSEKQGGDQTAEENISKTSSEESMFGRTRLKKTRCRGRYVCKSFKFQQ